VWEFVCVCGRREDGWMVEDGYKCVLGMIGMDIQIKSAQDESMMSRIASQKEEESSFYIRKSKESKNAISYGGKT
jgi:hypothetical protein